MRGGIGTLPLTTLLYMSTNGAAFPKSDSDTIRPSRDSETKTLSALHASYKTWKIIS